MLLLTRNPGKASIPSSHREPRNCFILQQSRVTNHVCTSHLLVAPFQDAVQWADCTPRREPAMATAEQIVHVSEFTNEPFIDFTKPENRSRMGEALKKVKSEFGREYPIWLGGQKVTTAEKRTSTNPYGRWKSSASSSTATWSWPATPSKPL